MSRNKKNTSRERDVDSKRSKKRAKRGIGPSRPNRRAERRMGHAYASYLDGAAANKVDGIKAFTCPGEQSKWS